MSSSRSSRGVVTLTAAVAAVAILLALLGSSALGRGGAPVPSPSPTTPSVEPSDPVTTPTPSARPDGEFSLDLDDPNDHAISVVVKDRTGTISDVRSDRPTVGMSVRWGDALVENVDSDTVRITWAGYPRDEAVSVAVERDGDGYGVSIRQGMPYPNTDAMGQDRVLVIDFDGAVDADDVAVTVENPASAD